jgi:hypothetical protein
MIIFAASLAVGFALGVTSNASVGVLAGIATATLLHAVLE